MSGENDHRSIHAYVHQGRIGVLLELASETQVVCAEAVFTDLAKSLTHQIASQDPSSIEALLSQPWIVDPSMSVSAMLREKSKELRERIRVIRFTRWNSEQHVPTVPPQNPSPPKAPAVIMQLRRRD